MRRKPTMTPSKNTQVFEGVYLDGRSIERTTTVSVPFVKKKKGYYRFDPHYPAIYFGFNKLASNTFQYSAKVPQLGSKSWEWGINLFNTGVAITRNNHWGLTTTLGLARIVYKLDDNYGFEKVDGITVCRQAEDVDYQKELAALLGFPSACQSGMANQIRQSPCFHCRWSGSGMACGVKSRAKYDDKNIL